MRRKGLGRRRKLLGSLAFVARRVDAETAVIWNSVSDSVAVQSVEGAEELCLSGKAYAMPDEGEGDYLKIVPNK